MKQKKLKKFLSSIKADIDVGHSEVVNEKKNIDKSFAAIFKLISAEDNSTAEHSNEASELHTLIQDLDRHYTSLYGSYDHLIGKLSEKVHDGKSNGSFSADHSSSDSNSSDSDSDKSDNGNGRSNSGKERGLGGEKISVEEFQYLQSQLEILKSRNVELETEVRSMSLKIKEGENLATKFSEREAEYFLTQDELNNTRKKIEDLQVENEKLTQEHREQEFLTNQRLESLKEENETLLGEKSVIYGRLEQAEKTVEEFQVKNEQLQNENAGVKGELQSLKDELNCTKESLLASQIQNGDLRQDLEKSMKLQVLTEQKYESLFLENSTVLKKLAEADGLVETYKVDDERLKNEISILQDANRVLKQELEAVVLQMDDLNRKLISTNEEKDSLSSENASLLEKIQLADKITRDLRDESDLRLNIVNERSAENAKLLAENEKLEAEKEAANKQVADLVQRCLTFEEDTNTLKSEIQGIISKMELHEKTIETLMTECELLKDEKSKLLGENEDLSSQMRAIGDEKASLSLEHDEAVNKLKKIQEDLEIVSKELELSNIEKTEMQAKYDGLNAELEAAICEVAELKKIIQALQEDKLAISTENSILLSRTVAFENEMHELKADKERLDGDNSVLKEKIDDLVHKLESVEEAKNMLESDKLSALAKLGESKSSLKGIIDEAEQLRKEICVFQQDQLDSQGKLSDLEKRLQDKEADFLSLERKLEEASAEIQTSTAHASNLQQAADSALIKISELEELVKTMTSEAMEKQSLAEKLESELAGKVLTQEMMLKEQKDSLEELSANYKLLESQLLKSSEDLEVAQGRIVELEKKEEIIPSLQGVVQEQKLQLNSLKDNLKELAEKLKFSESEKAELDKEVMKLSGEIQNLEVQIRLSNQKVKITETESKDKEEIHKRTVEALHEERRKLEEHSSTLSSRINLAEGDLRQVKESVQLAMESLGRAFDELELKLEGDCRRIHTHISDCSNDVILMKRWIKALVHSEEGLKVEKRELGMRLNYKEGIISMLKDESAHLRSKLDAKMKEEERLTQRVAELEKRESESNLELLSRDEEKREVIRQLCLLIEYHRENFDHVCKLLTATLNRSRRRS